MKNLFKQILLGFLGAALFQIVKPFFDFRSWATPTPPVMTVSGLNVVDQKGRIRMQLGFSKEGPPGIWVMDEQGVPRLIMGLYGDQTSYLGLQDKNGRMIELMRSFGEKEVPLLIFKHQGSDVMITGLNGEALPFLMYKDGQGQKNLFGKYGL